MSFLWLFKKQKIDKDFPKTPKGIGPNDSFDKETLDISEIINDDGTLK